MAEGSVAAVPQVTVRENVERCHEGDDGMRGGGDAANGGWQGSAIRRGAAAAAATTLCCLEGPGPAQH